MRHASLLLSIAAAMVQEPAPWRIVVEFRGTYVLYSENGKDCREESDFPPPKPGLSPDGRRRVYLVDEPEHDEIWVSDADGGRAKKLTDKGEVNGLPSWSPDGRRLAFSSNRKGSWQVWRIDADGAGLTRLTGHTDGVRGPQVSPRGDVVAYFELHPKEGKLPPVSLRLVPLEGGDSKVVFDQTQLLGFAWSPSGDRLACSLVGELRVLDSTTLKPVLSFTGKSIDRRLDSHAAFEMTWRPDGGAIAFRCTFLGGRTFGAKMFGDNEVFILPMKGAPAVIESGRPEVPVRWMR